MDQAELAREIISIYRKHGWTLQRVLLRPATHSAISGAEVLEADAEPQFRGRQIFGEASINDDAPIDALWFSRPSTRQREAWELRLLSETPYALFETFEKDEPEDAREDVRREMEARLVDYVMKK